MSVQDKVEHILKNIHLLFSGSKPYDQEGKWIIVEKAQVFELLEQLNLAIYEVMDQYEVTSQKHELAQRRCEKRGEEIIQKANTHADDIYAATIMYTDDAINRICHIMEDANESVRKAFHKMNAEMDQERERVRRNQLELTGQLQDFADTQKYIKIIEEINKKLERERMEEMKEQKEKRIQNEGKSYSAVQPEIRVNQAYFERIGKSYGLTQPEINPRKEEEESLARVTGKEFAESLRRRAARNQEQSLKIEDMSQEIENESQRIEDAFSSIPAVSGEERMFTDGTAGGAEQIFQEVSGSGGFMYQEETLPEAPPEIRVDLDAEYFKWKEGAQSDETSAQGKKERRFFFGRKSNSQ